MKNMEMKVEGDKWIVTVDLSKRFGKSIIIACSEDNQDLPGAEEIKIGLNVYTRPE